MRPRRFDDFYGCDALIGRLKGVAGEPVHAYLFCGPEGTGKRSLAAICARAINCHAAVKPCDECPSCRRYLNGSHPDHIVVTGEKSIGVTDVRALVERVSMRPFEGGRLTVVIEAADTMTVQAQNALLKTLEEPPGGAVFFLTAQRAAQLLPTVRSRVRLVRFAPLPDERVAGALMRLGIGERRAAELAGISQGSVGRALEHDRDEAYWALRERVTRSLEALKRPGDVADAFGVIKDDKPSAERVFAIMEQLARARMRAEAGDALGAALPPDAASLPAGLNLPGDKLLQAVMRARQMLASNVSWQSAVEMMYLDMIPICDQTDTTGADLFPSRCVARRLT